MASTTKQERRKSQREIAYYRTRYKNRLHAKLLAFFVEEMKTSGITQRDVAQILDREPAQISRWLSRPSNLTAESISDLLFALDAEPMPPEIVRFSEIRPRQYAHPLIARATGVEVLPKTVNLNTSNAGTSVGARHSVKYERANA